MINIKCSYCNKTVLAKYANIRSTLFQEKIKYLKWLLSEFPCLRCSGEKDKTKKKLPKD